MFCMDFGAIPAPAEQQCGGETGEEQGCILPTVAGSLCLLQALPMDKVQLCSLSELGETLLESAVLVCQGPTSSWPVAIGRVYGIALNPCEVLT